MPRPNRACSAANDNHGRRGCLLSDTLYLALILLTYGALVMGVKA